MKTMKYIILCLFSLVLTTTSCEGFLDITPEGQVKRDPMLSTPEGIEDAMYGVYSQMRSNALYGQELYFSALEILSQTMWCKGAEGITALGEYDWEHSSVTSILESVWVSMYKNISNVNSILDAPLVADASEYPYTVYRGEALGMRAFMHFDLVRLFTEQYTVNPTANGIPYATEFSLKTPQFETLEKNYEHILADLLEAETLLLDEDEHSDESTFMLDRQIHFNLYAVQATLARVYLTMGDNVQAAIYARKVINANKYTLTDKTNLQNDIKGVLSANETLFGIYHPGFYTAVNAKLEQMTSFYSLDLRGDFMSLYEKDASGWDFRTQAYFSNANDQDKYRLSKFTDYYEKNNITCPETVIKGINLIRLPEMYLIAAEALLDTEYDTALELFETVRSNRGLEPLDDTKTLTQEMINDERYRELIGEGQTYFNMKRQNLDILSHDGKSTYTPADGIYAAPIPDIEIENRN